MTLQYNITRFVNSLSVKPQNVFKGLLYSCIPFIPLGLYYLFKSCRIDKSGFKYYLSPAEKTNIIKQYYGVEVN